MNTTGIARKVVPAAVNGRYGAIRPVDKRPEPPWYRDPRKGYPRPGCVFIRNGKR